MNTRSVRFRIGSIQVRCNRIRNKIGAMNRALEPDAHWLRNELATWYNGLEDTERKMAELEDALDHIERGCGILDPEYDRRVQAEVSKSEKNCANPEDSLERMERSLDRASRRII